MADADRAVRAGRASSQVVSQDRELWEAAGRGGSGGCGEGMRGGVRVSGVRLSAGGRLEASAEVSRRCASDQWLATRIVQSRGLRSKLGDTGLDVEGEGEGEAGAAAAAEQVQESETGLGWHRHAVQEQTSAVKWSVGRGKAAERAPLSVSRVEE